MNKKIVVAGATGEVGRRLVEKLVAQNANNTIHVLVRAESSLFSSNVQQHIVDFDDLNTLKLGIQFDLAYSCLGTTIKKAGSEDAFKYVDHELTLKFAQWAQDNGCQHFACISAAGADASSTHFYLALKGQTEQALMQIGFRQLWLIRPSLLLGQRDEFRLGEYLGALFSFFISPFMIGPIKKYKPIHMIRVAHTMAKLVNKLDEQAGCRVLQGEVLF